MKRTGAAFVAGVLAVSGAALIVPAQAQASARITARLAPRSHSISAGSAPSFTYKITNRPSGSRLYLQEQEGTRKRWINVKRLTRAAGTTSGPKLSIGRYPFRVVEDRRGSVVASPAEIIFAYGNVSVHDLCTRDNHLSYNDGDCSSDTGTVQVGSQVYSWASYAGEYNSGPDQSADWVVTRSSCRSGSLTYAVDNDDASSDGVNNLGLSVTQSAANSQEFSSTPNQIASASFSLTSSNWDLAFWTDAGATVYFNGSFSCYTQSGAR